MNFKVIANDNGRLDEISRSSALTLNITKTQNLRRMAFLFFGT